MRCQPPPIVVEVVWLLVAFRDVWLVVVVVVVMGVRLRVVAAYVKSSYQVLDRIYGIAVSY